METWKTNLEESKKRYENWWNRRGLVLRSCYEPDSEHGVHEEVKPPPAAESKGTLIRDPDLHALHLHYELARRAYPADNIPASGPNFGADSLALVLGCRPSFAESTIWYHPAESHAGETGDIALPVLDEDNEWWRIMQRTLRCCKKLAAGRYYVGMPTFNAGLDTLAALRDTQTLMMDLIMDPGWVHDQLRAINDIWREVYDRCDSLIRADDDWSHYRAFSVFGPGKCAQVQCDAAAMLSPEMFREFEAPVLADRCRHLDHSLFHLDGTQALNHLDALLEIEELDAIEWTPQDGIEPGGNPRWYDLYRRILEAGKCVQVVGVGPADLEPLLDAIGTDGVYVMLDYLPENELRRVTEPVLA